MKNLLGQVAMSALLTAAVFLPGAVSAGELPPEAAALMEPLPLSPKGQPVPGHPDGAPASPADVLVITEEDIAKLKAGNFTAGIAMQALDSPWNTLQVEAITKTLADYGVEVVAVTNASYQTTKQADDLDSLIARGVDVIFSVPLDPQGQAATYQRVAKAGVRLVFMDNVPHDMTPGEDYVTVVASDNEKNAVYATEQLIEGIGGSGEVGLITYIYDFYYSIAARNAGFEKAVAANPDVRIVAREKISNPREAYEKSIAMLTAHPEMKGIFAVWGDPAMQAVSGARSIGRDDVIVTTNDLGADSALFVARGDIPAIGAQLPYDLGVAEAKAAALALLGKSVPPYISLPSLRVQKVNLISALERVTNAKAPQDVVDACDGGCN